MDALTDYLRGEYADDRAAIDRRRALAGEALRTLVRHARRPEVEWPRELVDGGPVPAAPTGPRGRLVIAAMLARLAGRLPQSVVTGGDAGGSALPPGVDRAELEAVADAGVAHALGAALRSHAERGVLVDDPAHGADDPFALALLLLLARVGPVDPALESALREAARETVRRAFEDPRAPLLRIAAPDGDVGVAHALPLLNAVHVRLVLGEDDVPPAAIRAHVDAQVHRALSLRAMGDVSFDAAELAFFLEVRPLALCVHLALESGVALERFGPWVAAALRDALGAEVVRDGHVAAALSAAVADAAADR